MPEIIANPPWYIPVFMAIASLALLFMGTQSRNKTMKLGGLILAMIASAIVIIGQVIESDQEKVVRKTHELAAAVDARDWGKFGTLLDPEVKFYFYSGRNDLVAGATKTAEGVGVKNISLGNMVVKFEANAYQVDFSATADFDKMPYRTPTNWRFFWSKSPKSGEFELYNIEAIASPQANVDSVLKELRRP